MVSGKYRFTHKQVSAATGVDRGLLRAWVRRGHVHTTGRAAVGRGSPSLFDIQETLVIALMKSLREMGLRLERAAEVSRAIVESYIKFFSQRPSKERNDVLSNALPRFLFVSSEERVGSITIDDAYRTDLSFAAVMERFPTSVRVIDVGEVINGVLRSLAPKVSSPNGAMGKRASRQPQTSRLVPIKGQTKQKRAPKAND